MYFADVLHVYFLAVVIVMLICEHFLLGILLAFGLTINTVACMCSKHGLYACMARSVLVSLCVAASVPKSCCCLQSSSGQDAKLLLHFCTDAPPQSPQCQSSSVPTSSAHVIICKEHAHFHAALAPCIALPLQVCVMSAICEQSMNILCVRLVPVLL